MIRSIHAELVKLTRPRFAAIALLVTIVVAAGLTAVGVLVAEPAGPTPSSGPRLLSIEALADPGGGTAVFAQTAAFGAVFLLAVFIATVAGELTRGTFRTMLLQQPARGHVLAGKVVAIVGYASALALVGAVVGWSTARLLAPGQGIDTSRWISVDALTAGAEDYGRLVAFIAGWAVLATVVGVLARSVPIGVGVGLVWAGPIENVIGDGWSPGERWFPGLVLRALIAPDAASISTGRALATLAGYAAIAVGVTAIALRRRDVTA
jgi:hypothetical protein